MTLDQFDLAAQTHQRFPHHILAGCELVADGPHRRRHHAMPLEHQILDHPRMTPCQQGVDTFHLEVKPVVSLVADGHDGKNAPRRIANQIGQFPHPFIAGDAFGILDARVFPLFENFFVHINTGDAQRPEEIALAAFVHTQSRQEHFGIQDFLVTHFRLLEDLGFKHKLDELLSPLPLQYQLAALVKNHVQLFLGGGEPRVGHIAEHIIMLLQMIAQQRGLGVVQFASMARDRFHNGQSNFMKFNASIRIPMCVGNQELAHVWKHKGIVIAIS